MTNRARLLKDGLEDEYRMYCVRQDYYNSTTWATYYLMWSGLASALAFQAGVNVVGVPDAWQIPFSVAYFGFLAVASFLLAYGWSTWNKAKRELAYAALRADS